MKTNIFIILTFNIFCLLPSIAQIAEGQNEQTVDTQKDEAVKQYSFTKQHIVVAGAAIGRPTSFRLQIGVVNKVGFYTALSTNFRLKMQDDGYSKYPEDFMLSGKYIYDRWIFHAGPMIRVNPDFIIYLGMGLGYCMQFEESVSGKLNRDHHYDFSYGFDCELDIGFLYRVKYLLVNVGGSCGIKPFRLHPSFNIGLGVIF